MPRTWFTVQQQPCIAIPRGDHAFLSLSTSRLHPKTNEAREIRTPNLLIWSQTRCRCAIAPHVCCLHSRGDSSCLSAAWFDSCCDGSIYNNSSQLLLPCRLRWAAPWLDPRIPCAVHLPRCGALTTGAILAWDAAGPGLNPWSWRLLLFPQLPPPALHTQRRKDTGRLGYSCALSPAPSSLVPFALDQQAILGSNKTGDTPHNWGFFRHARGPRANFHACCGC